MPEQPPAVHLLGGALERAVRDDDLRVVLPVDHVALEVDVGGVAVHLKCDLKAGETDTQLCANPPPLRKLARISASPV